MPLRAALDRKDTDFVVKFIKDNNLSVDVEMRDKRTPLMYSSFRNDVNTFNALLNLGAGSELRIDSVYLLWLMLLC